MTYRHLSTASDPLTRTWARPSRLLHNSLAMILSSCGLTSRIMHKVTSYNPYVVLNFLRAESLTALQVYTRVGIPHPSVEPESWTLGPNFEPSMKPGSKNSCKACELLNSQTLLRGTVGGYLQKYSRHP